MILVFRDKGKINNLQRHIKVYREEVRASKRYTFFHQLPLLPLHRLYRRSLLSSALIRHIMNLNIFKLCIGNIKILRFTLEL